MLTNKIIDFMGKRMIAAVISVVLIVASIASLTTKGLNLGLDFTGGTLVELHYSAPPELETVRGHLADMGYTNAVVVHFGSDTELLVRLQSDSGKLDENGDPVNVGEKIAQGLDDMFEGSVDLMRSEIMGAQIGEELANDGGLGLLTAFAAVFLYVAVRFQSKFSVGALAALIHDSIIVVGFFSITQLEFDLTVLAAILAMIGYSINDTIVVFDRIRENFRIIREEPPAAIINESLTQILGRTLVTSGTTVMVLLALFFVGGELIHNFSIALLVGVGVGTYSSIYVASSILLSLHISKEDLMPPEKEGEEFEDQLG